MLISSSTTITNAKEEWFIEILLPYLIGNLSIYGNKGITDKSIPLLKEKNMIITWNIH